MAFDLPGNFVSSTLRAPMLSGDSVMQLAAGTGTRFDVTAGNYYGIVISNGGQFEVVRYNSAGPIVGDNMTVARAQEGTIARTWPIGACVAVAWTEGQLQNFIDLILTNLLPTLPFPANTESSTSNPVGAPTDPNVIYHVNTSTLILYYWTGVAWIPLTSGGGGGGTVVTISSIDPAGAPASGTYFHYNSATSTLWVWDGVQWDSVNAHRTLGVQTQRVGAGSFVTDAYGHAYSVLGGLHQYTRYVQTTTLQSFPATGATAVNFSTADSRVADTVNPANVFIPNGATGIAFNGSINQCLIQLVGQISVSLVSGSGAFYFRGSIAKDPAPTRIAFNSVFSQSFSFASSIAEVVPSCNIVSPVFLAAPGDIYRLYLVNSSSNPGAVTLHDSGGGNYADTFLSARVVAWL